jgi:hypothetical protein
MAYKKQPKIRIGLRPYRSDMGPYTIGAVEKPSMKMGSVRAAIPAEVAKDAAIWGTAGRLISIDNGGKAAKEASRPVKAIEFGRILKRVFLTRRR